MGVTGKSRDWWELQGSRGIDGSGREVKGLVGVAGKLREWQGSRRTGGKGGGVAAVLFNANVFSPKTFLFSSHSS